MTAARLFDTGPLRFLPAALREPRRAWLAILIGFLLSVTGSLFLSWAAQGLAPTLGKPVFPMSGATAILLLVVFAPLVETLIMAAILALLTRFLPATAAILVSALLWGIAHSLQAPVWGLIIWWPFVIFSTLYVVWRQRGVWAGIGVAATAHALQNLGPALIVSKLV
ncbi:MAG: CPBP family glutamic-type intramembrane protease [Pseudomonadota bacterium]|nr:CPBP family glutamic-type intramembrane protease [Pseudomonadota bacterium]